MASSEPTQVAGLGLTIPPGTRLNGVFEIERQIGAGGMGMVYVAHNVETGDKVAIKIVRTEMAGNEQVLALFRKEAAVLHRLLHDAIVRYYLFTSDPGIGRPYLATEFVDGTSLSDMGAIARDEVLALAERLASGLQAAHEMSVFHRDISPDNVILPERDVRKAKIIDFGIARSATLGGGTVIGDSIAGKFDYMSPEQLGLYGGQVDARSDIYSLGIVLAEAVLGRSLKMGGTQLDVVEKRRKVPDLSGIEPRLRALLAAMLQPRPDDRMASMAAVAASARKLRLGAVAGPGKRPLGKMAAGVVVLLAAGGVAAWLLIPDGDTGVAPPAPPVLVRQSGEPAAPPTLVAANPGAREAEGAADEGSAPGGGEATAPGSAGAAAPGSGEAAALGGGDATAPASAEANASGGANVALPGDGVSDAERTDAATDGGETGVAADAAAVPGGANAGAEVGGAGDATAVAQPGGGSDVGTVGAVSAGDDSADETPAASDTSAADAAAQADAAEVGAVESVSSADADPQVAAPGTDLGGATGTDGAETAAQGTTDTAGSGAAEPDPAATLATGEPGASATDTPPPFAGSADQASEIAATTLPVADAGQPDDPGEATAGLDLDETDKFDIAALAPGTNDVGASAAVAEDAPAIGADAASGAPLGDPSEPVAEPPDDGSVQEARLVPDDLVPDDEAALDLPGRINRFLRGAALGPCAFVQLAGAGPEQADIVAYGNTVPPFQTLDENFRDTFQFSADINLRPVSDGQCPAIELAQALDTPGSDRLRLRMDSDAVTPGGLLSGAISGIGQRTLHLYLVAGDGHLYGLEDLIERNGDKATFRASMASSEEGLAHHVLIAVAAESLPNLPSRADGNSADELATLRAYLADDPDAEAALGYFKFGR